MVGLGVASPSVARLAHHALGRPGFGSDVDEILGERNWLSPSKKVLIFCDLCLGQCLVESKCLPEQQVTFFGEANIIGPLFNGMKATNELRKPT